MLTIGLTGNIGSGKSTICKIFKCLGIAVFNADVEAKKLLFDDRIKEKIMFLFSDSIIKSDGHIDTKKLSTIVFNDSLKLKQLNQIIHPEVYKLFKNWQKDHSKSKYIIMEAAILFESGFDQYVNLSINVYASQKTRISRVKERDKMSDDLILKRMQNQLSDKEKVNLSTFTINNEDELVIPQVLKIHSKLLSIA